MTDLGLVTELTILVLSIFLGFEVISKVPTMLHTPLMSGTNFIHGIVIVGAIVVLGYADDGVTKGELAAYYEMVAPVMLPHIVRRPITMERYPSGIGRKGFFQKDVSKGFPPWLRRIEVPKKGGKVHHPLVTDSRSLLWLANQNCITPHVWTSRAPNLFNPDICVFDLDPSVDEPDVLRAAALQVRDVLTELGLPSWIKTSGSKGFHIAVPLDGKAGFGEVERFAYGVARILIKRDPENLTLEFIKAHVPESRVTESAELCARMGAQVTKRIYPGMGHTIIEDEIRWAQNLLDALGAA